MLRLFLPPTAQVVSTVLEVPMTLSDTQKQVPTSGAWSEVLHQRRNSRFSWGLWSLVPVFSTKTNNWCGKIKKLSARWVDYGLMGYLWWLIGFTMVYRTTYPLVIEHSYAKWSVYRWFTSKKWWCSSSLSSFTRDNHGLPHYLGVTVTMLSASFLSQALKSGAVWWFLDSVAASGSRQMGPLWHRTFWGLKNR